MRNSAFAAAALLAAASTSTHTWAQGKTIYLAAFGGQYETVLREKVFPNFEREHNVKVEYVPGISSETLAKVIASRSNPQIDIAIMDEGPTYQAIELGLCDALSQDKAYDDVYPLAKKFDEKAVAINLSASGILYNTEYFKQQGWPAPSSWKDLRDPKFAGKLALPPLSNTYGLHTLVMQAVVDGGGEQDIEPGFRAFIDQINPHVLTYEASPGQMSALFQNNQVVVSAWGLARAAAMQKTGFPVEMSFPKEGAVAVLISACAVSGKQQPEAQALIRYLLSSEVQQVFAQEMGYGPVNATTKLPETVAKTVPYGADAVEHLRVIDWSYVNKVRQEWNTRWTREVER